MAERDDPHAPDMQWVFGEKGPLARKDGYSVRPGQVRMAQGCAAAFRDRFILLAEAGTGIGKTYAYLIPALLSGQCTVISVRTRALQDQLFCHDIPEVLKLLGNPPCRISLLKGLENYLCLKKYYAALDSGGLGAPFDSRTLIDFVERALAASGSGRADSAPGDISQGPDISLLRRFAYSKHYCMPQSCPHYGQCFAFAARARAVDSDLTVVNHSLMFHALEMGDHLREDRAMLPHFDNLILDECHTLCDAGRSVYTLTYSTLQIRTACRTFMQELRREAADLEPVFLPVLTQLRAANQQLMDHLTRLEVMAISMPALKYMDYRPELQTEPAVNPEFARLIGILTLCFEELSDLCTQHGERAPDVMRPFWGELREQRDHLLAAVYNDRDASLAPQIDRSAVAYAELHADGCTISVAPITIGEHFGRHMFKLSEQQVGTVMTSATLSVAGDFSSFTRDTLGDLVATESMVVPSAFDYRHNTRLYYSADFPAADDEHRIHALIAQLHDVIDIVRGGTLFLATSHKAVREAGMELEKRFRGRRLVLWQNMPGSPSVHELLTRFRQDGHAILVGTSVFWEGVDVPGPALTLVIIDRLPFHNPTDPVYQALVEKIKAEHGRDCSFGKVMLPEAIIRLRQGVGRLVRSETDRGAVIIADPRLATRRYRHVILKALPDMGRCTGLGELRAFLQSI